MLFDKPVQVNVDKVLSRRGSPVAKQPWLDLFSLERLTQKRILKQVDLADAKIVCRTPVPIHLVQHLRRERPLGLRGSFFVLAVGSNRG